ncbi:uncharacterized protein LOC134704820 [Mytilus trossulus]|uniref:uncharacterized protein LOC134704820 n=1 Tax=Mytilus trossulus TaxID=6551 RepID=UPI003004C96F
MARETSVIEGADLVRQIIEHDGQIKQKVIQIYDHIKKFIESKEFMGTDVEDEVKTEFGDILENIEKQKEKVMVDECPIVIAGETSAGKSSFINLLLGKDILPSQLLSCTTTICRLRNSEKVGIAVTDEDDKKINIDVDYVDDKNLRSQLKKYVSRTSDQENYKYVDISLPIPLLKSHTLIIDTPGIGTSPELNNRLLDFLPNAMAFIYIINSSNAGGLQGDRLLQIFESQNDRVKRTRMQEFDTKTTIFVCNKWEQVPEEEEEDVMNFICSVLKDSWPNLNVEGQIYKLSVKKERDRKREGLEFTENFKRLMSGIERLIPASLEKRITRHTRIKRSVIEQASAKCASISKELYTYLNKKETTDRMFKFSVHEYPTGRYQWFIKEKAKDLILGRINAETREWCRMNMVENINVELKAILQESFSTVHSEMEEGRKELSEFEISLDKRYSFDTSTRDRNFLDDFEDTVLSWPILPIAFPLSFVITAVLTPLLIPLVIKDIIDKLDRHGYNENKQEQMQKWCLEFLKEYNQQSIQKLIEETYLDDFITRVKHLTDHVIPKRIEADEKYIHHIIEDLRNSSLISRQYRPLENRCMFILGMIMLLDMDLEFSGFKHSDEYIGTHNTADTEIGRGAFSDVYSTEILKANKYKKAAVKTLRHPLEGNEESYIQLAEVHNLRRFCHTNIVELYGISYKCDKEGTKYLQIFMELCDNSLDNIILNDANRRWRPCCMFENLEECQEAFDFFITILLDICRGLLYIHNKGFVHRDLKLSNILIKDGRVKIADMGVAKEVSHILGTLTGTLTTIAPGVYHGKLYGTEADIYSLGIIMWEIWYCEAAYSTMEYNCLNMHEFADCIKEGKRPTFNTGFAPPTELKNIIELCWSPNPNVRPSAENVFVELSSLMRL